MENLYYRKCPKCKTEVDYQYIPEKGWMPFLDAEFEVGEWYVNLICPKCGWRINTQIKPKNVYKTIEEYE